MIHLIGRILKVAPDSLASSTVASREAAPLRRCPVSPTPRAVQALRKSLKLNAQKTGRISLMSLRAIQSIVDPRQTAASDPEKGASRLHPGSASCLRLR